ncbi:MAG: glycosyltransferase [Actinomycetota bacterium]
MHVLYLIDSLVPGGAERSLAALAPGYVARGVKLDVGYLQDRPGLQHDLLQAGANLFCLDGPGGRLGWIRRTRALARERRFDLIHTTLADANLAGRIGGRLAGVPVVSSLVNVQYGPEHSSDPNVLAWRMKLLQLANALTAQGVVRFHAVTREIADVMSRRLRVPLDRIEVIPRGRDPRALGRRTAARRTAIRGKLGVSDNTIFVLAAARHEFQKRLDLLIEAMPQIRRELGAVTLLVAGREGSATQGLQEVAGSLGVAEHIQFLGARDDVPELLCASDVLVLPSRREGLPGILIEALALETPIVASDLLGVREVVDDQTARLVATARAEDLAAAVVESVRDVAGSSRRVAEGRARFEATFTIDAVADRMVAFYDRALGCRPKGDRAGSVSQST